MREVTHTVILCARRATHCGGESIGAVASALSSVLLFCVALRVLGMDAPHLVDIED
jgi:hypothetical protein